MSVLESIKNRRTIRKFEQKPVTNDELLKLIDSTRYAACGANMQPLKYAILNDHKKIYPLTKWAGYLKDWEPAEDERPLSYIAILGDTKIKNQFEVDAGSAIATMIILAEEMGLATCWLGAIKRDEIKNILNTDLSVLYLLAVGYPKQKSVVTNVKNGDIKYFEDENGVINVPKRSLDEILYTLK